MNQQFEAHHINVLDAFHKVTQNPKASEVLNKLRAASIPWPIILGAIVAQIPNIIAGNWTAVIAALIALAPTLFPPNPTPAGS